RRSTSILFAARHAYGEADVSQPTISAETVENDPLQKSLNQSLLATVHRHFTRMCPQQVATPIELRL
ncbi:hypothetical protein, partial [Bradyrhizobium elkanii]|uniref:hypothetical protein n=1 Tax=Bradyrhizobium elkanii TaxID=29448 RepID=UPI001AEBC863